MKGEFDKEVARARVIANYPLMFKNRDRKWASLKVKEQELTQRINKWVELMELRHKNKQTLQEIGEKYGVSRERIRQLLLFVDSKYPL